MMLIVHMHFTLDYTKKRQEKKKKKENTNEIVHHPRFLNVLIQCDPTNLYKNIYIYVYIIFLIFMSIFLSPITS